MEPKHRKLLRAQRLYLCEQLIVDDTVVQYLYQEDILTECQVEEIQSQKSNKNKTLMLLSILPSRGPNAFNVFVQSLDLGFPWIKEKLLLLAEDDDGGGRGTELSDTTGEFHSSSTAGALILSSSRKDPTKRDAINHTVQHSAD